jgi:hypothetical protein
MFYIEREHVLTLPLDQSLQRAGDAAAAPQQEVCAIAPHSFPLRMRAPTQNKTRHSLGLIVSRLLAPLRTPFAQTAKFLHKSI